MIVRMESALKRIDVRAGAVSAAILAMGLSAAPAEAHHTSCKWGVNVVVEASNPSDPVHYGPPLAMWGCHGPVVWATVVGPDGSRTFVPVYGAPNPPRPQPESSPVAEEDSPRSQPSRSRAKKAKSKCKRRGKRSSRKTRKRCASRSNRAKARRR